MMAPFPKRRKVEQVEELTFDPTARQDYLTGFHKRKVQRAGHARELAEKKAREEKVEARKQVKHSVMYIRLTLQLMVMYRSATSANKTSRDMLQKLTQFWKSNRTTTTPTRTRRTG